MSLILRTTALMLLVLSRAPAFAAMPSFTSNQDGRETKQNQVSSKAFKHNLSGLYGIESNHVTPLQPYADFDVLYSKAHQAQAELETLCKGAALLTNTEPHFAGVKSYQRSREKIQHELAGRTERITDLARATLVANDVASLMQAYEILSRETQILKVKNRFKKPAESGYRDLNVLVQLPKTQLIAEVQLHLKAIADVKSGPEHQIYERIQEIQRRAAQQNRAFNEIETAQIAKMRSESQRLYQDAWQPYLTTHLSAA